MTRSLFTLALFMSLAAPTWAQGPAGRHATGLDQTYFL